MYAPFRVNLELFSASDIMTHSPIVVPLVDTVANLSRFLIDNNHCGFPVVTITSEDLPKPVFFGMITR